MTLHRKIRSKHVGVTAASILLLSLCSAAQSEERAHPTVSITGPDAVENLLIHDRSKKHPFSEAMLLADWNRWKNEYLEHNGFILGADYNALMMTASASSGEKSAGSGAFRFYGSWKLPGMPTGYSGGIVFKIENRHAYTQVTPNVFGAELGYVGVVNTVYGNQKWRATHLFWRQYFRQSSGMAWLGYLDTTDFTDAFSLASPWSGFGNMVFENGSGTIGGMPDGALGFMVTGFIADEVYATAAVVDANGKASDLGGETAAFFDDFETFKTLEVGWTPSNGSADNIHLTLWQIDAVSNAAASAGWGVAFSASGTIHGEWTPFLRGGWSEKGGSQYDAALAAGFGYQPAGRPGMLGVGLSVARPNENTYGKKLNNQLTGECFYKLQYTHRLEVTPNLQLLGSPALNPDTDAIWLFGLRARIVL